MTGFSLAVGVWSAVHSMVGYLVFTLLCVGVSSFAQLASGGIVIHSHVVLEWVAVGGGA